MSEARDVDLGEWLDGIGFKPANTELKQQGHEAVRQVVANLGAVLHPLIPAGRDKSVAYKLIEDVLMRLNRALAIGGGPVQFPGVERYLEDLLNSGPLEPDPRVDAYKREQRGEPV